MADISKITLPSGNTYDIKDAVARDMISGGITFTTVWSSTDYASTSAPSTAKKATIPAGVTVYYNNGASSTTGTLTASADTKGKFYLIYSETQEGSVDFFNEYVTVEEGTSYFWEKIGDTQMNLGDTAEVIGQNATLTFNRPTVAVSPTNVVTGGTAKYMSATASGGNVSLTTKKITGTASGGSVAWDDQDIKGVLTGVKVTAQPTIGLTANSATATGRIKYVEAISSTSASGTSSTLTATATGGDVAANTDDTVTALIGLGAPSTGTAVSGVSTSKLVTTSITGVSGSTSVTGVSGSVSVTGVQSSTTTASKATAVTSQTTATGTYTVVNPPSSASTTDANSNSVYDSDECILVWPNVVSETLILRAATLDTQTTTQHTFADVTVPIKAASATTVPVAATSATTVPVAATATTVATGALNTSGSGATVATGSSGSITAVTGYPNITTDDVLGADTTFDVTQPTITPSLSSVITAVSGGTTTSTTKYLSASASGTTVGANGTTSVIGSNSTFTVTQPTIALTTDASATSGYATVATAINTVTQPTITLSAGDTSSTGSQKFIQNVSSKAPSVTLSGGSVTWANKDLKTAYVEANDADA